MKRTTELKRIILILILIWACFILQTAAFSMLGFITVKPSLMLAIPVSVGFLRGKREGLVFGFICGIMLDIFYGNILGLYAMLYMYLGFAAGLFNNVFYEDDLRIPVIMTFAADIIAGTFIYLGGFFLRGKLFYPEYFITVIIPEAVFTAVITVIIYRILYIIDRGLSGKQYREEGRKWLKG